MYNIYVYNIYVCIFNDLRETCHVFKNQLFKLLEETTFCQMLIVRMLHGILFHFHCFYSCRR